MGRGVHSTANVTGEVTQILATVSAGDRPARERLWEILYPHLRELAAARMRRERPDHTLQPTALAHEAYLKLLDQRTSWQGRAHFLAIASEIMRRILVDHERRRRRTKRGGAAAVRLDLAEIDRRARPIDTNEPDLLDLDDALNEFARFAPREAQVVQMKYFAGMSEREIAHVLGVSERTIGRDWTAARKWLVKQLQSK